MKTMNILDKKGWLEVQLIIHDVLKRRKSQFTIEQILDVIMYRMIQKKINISAMNCTYFKILFLNILETLIEDNSLYQMDEIYIPSNYMILRDYHTIFTDLLYLDNPEIWSCVKVETLETVSSYQPRDFILTGGFIDKEKQILSCPEIPLEEIALLYQDFIKEGVKKEDVINYILNCYKIKRLKPINQCINVVKINNKVKKKVFTKID